MKWIALGVVLTLSAQMAMAEITSVLRPKARPAIPLQPEGDWDGRSRAAVSRAVPAMTVAGVVSAIPPVAPAAPGLGAIRPPVRRAVLPRTRWQHKEGHALWTQTALSALKAHGKPLVDMVPGDIATWCPAYPEASDTRRRAFWVGFLSALAKHESTYKARAVGGGGRWFGLLQIAPATARAYDCNVGTGDALKSGAANLSCAVRIMAVTVPRDGVIHGSGGSGVAADWGPMQSSAKRRDMADWLKRQAYCQPISTPRPRARP